MCQALISPGLLSFEVIAQSRDWGDRKGRSESSLQKASHDLGQVIVS